MGVVNDMRDGVDMWLELVGRNAPIALTDAVIFVHDTLDVARRSAVVHFGDNPPWAAVMAIYDRMNDRVRYVKDDEVLTRD
jgi:hypothetical protein